MMLLFPLGLLWLGSLPVLVWLWRLATSRHRTVISSLVPFEHLLPRAPTRRTRLVINWLFWLQVAALILAALALAEPVIIGRPTTTIFMLLDTSASMAASDQGPSAWTRAKREAMSRIAHARPAERFFVVRTAPVSVLTPTPTNDTGTLRELIDRLAPAELAGDLSVAERIGRAMLGTAPDATVVYTDEPAPSHLDERAQPASQQGSALEFHSLGRPIANVAIVSVEAYEPLCAAQRVAPRDASAGSESDGATPSGTQVMVTAQNFSEREQEATVQLRFQHRTAAERTLTLKPGEQSSVSLMLPGQPQGFAEVTLQVPHDGLAVDNHALVQLRGDQALQVLVASPDPAFLETVGHWLEACPGLAWTKTSEPPTPGTSASGLVSTSPTLLITDQAEWANSWPSSVIHFAATSETQPVRSLPWLVESPHPVAEYLSPLQTVPTALRHSPETAVSGLPVVWGLIDHQQVPVATVGYRAGRRLVELGLTPAATPNSTPLILVFFNSLRWLAGSAQLFITGEPLVVGPLDPGDIQIERPDGLVDRQLHEGGLLRYDATDRAGVYRITQGRHTIERAVNFLNAVESNTQQQVSTWRGSREPVQAPAKAPAARRPLTTGLLQWLLLLWMAEWVLYTQRRRQWAWLGRRERARPTA